MKKMYTKPEIEMLSLVSAENVSTGLIETSNINVNKLTNTVDFANITKY